MNSRIWRSPENAGWFRTVPQKYFVLMFQQNCELRTMHKLAPKIYFRNAPRNVLNVAALCELDSSGPGYALVKMFSELISFHKRWDTS